MNKHLIYILIALIVTVTTIAYANNNADDVLAEVKLGITSKELLKKYPSLYKHNLIMGETLYEACNQKRLEVFTFADTLWSKEYITHIGVHHADVSVCRDNTGALPDLSLIPSTPRGITLGSSEKDVTSKYGEPYERKKAKNGSTSLRYKIPSSKTMFRVINVVLVFSIENDKVISISLAGDRPEDLQRKKEIENRFR